LLLGEEAAEEDGEERLKREFCGEEVRVVVVKVREVVSSSVPRWDVVPVVLLYVEKRAMPPFV
jgi:hypothetical protein